MATRPASGPACGADNLLLTAGYVFKREFHPQITTRHHQRIRQLDNGVEPVDSRGLLQLGEDTGTAGHNLSRLRHILRPLHKGQGNPVNLEGQGVIEVRPVFGR